MGRLRRCYLDTALTAPPWIQISIRCFWRGSKRVACMPWPMYAAVGNTVKTGTKQGRSAISRTQSAISWLAQITSSNKDIREILGWPGKGGAPVALRLEDAHAQKSCRIRSGDHKCGRKRIICCRFETTPSGPPNIVEIGSVKTREGFEALYAMDAYHHVKNGERYPAVLLTTGINDPRVEPWVTAKMAARLQAATASGKPVLLRVDYDAGHGLGSAKAQAVAQLADTYAFLFWGRS